MQRSGRDHSKNAKHNMCLPVDCCYLVFTSSQTKMQPAATKLQKERFYASFLTPWRCIFVCGCKNSTSEDLEKRQYSQCSQTPLLLSPLWLSLRLRTVPPDRWIFSPSYGHSHRPIYDRRIKLPTEIFPCAHKPGAFLDILRVALPTKGCSTTCPGKLNIRWFK